MSPLVIVRGTGSIGQRHLRVLRERLGIPAIAFPAGRARGEEGSVDSLEAAAALRPGLAIIASSTGRHVKDAIDMMSIGCHVLVEKPLACDLRGADEIATAAAKLQRRVYVGCCLRFHPGLLEFRRRLREIGPVHYVRIECQSYLPDWRPGRDYRESYSASAAEGGVVRDLIHEIDYATWLYGRPTEVFARLENRGRLEIESEEAADLLWTVPGGPTISIRLDYISRTHRRRMRAFGELGELEWDASAPAAPEDPDAVYTSQSRAFVAASRGDDPGPLADLEDGRLAMWIHDQAKLAGGRID